MWGTHREPVNSPHKWPVFNRQYALAEGPLSLNKILTYIEGTDKQPHHCIIKFPVLLCLLIILNISLRWSQAYFINDILLAIQFWWRIRLAVIQLFATRSQPIFYICQDSTVVAPCTKFCRNQWVMIDVSVKGNCKSDLRWKLPIWFAMECR